MAAAAPLPTSAPLPAAAPFPNDSTLPTAVIPVAPPISKDLLNRSKMPKFFVNTKEKSHGKQWIAKCLENMGMVEIKSGFLPNAKCAFIWCQREYAYHDDVLLCGKEIKPCIGFIPSQGLLVEKTKFAQTLHKYYGNDAWKLTPFTMDIQWDKSKEEWIITDQIKKLIESKQSNHVWIVKSNFGAQGSGISLYRGNTIQSFSDFLSTRYKPQGWGKKMEEFGYNCDNLNLRQLILQQYIDKPLLFNNGYKFDLRVYTLLASTNPCILFYHIGKMRICGVKYNNLSNMNDDDTKDMMESEELLYGHLSNCKIQRSHNNYDRNSSSIDGQKMLNDWDSFIKYIYHIAINKKQFKQEWFEKYQYKINEMTLNDMKDLINIKCSRLLTQCYDANKAAFDEEGARLNRPCQFVFHGDDIIIDEDGNFMVLELNRVASISLVGLDSIKQMTKVMLKEMVDILMEIRQLKIDRVTVDQNTSLKSCNKWIRCKLNYKLPIVDRVDAMIHGLDKLLN